MRIEQTILKKQCGSMSCPHCYGLTSGYGVCPNIIVDKPPSHVSDKDYMDALRNAYGDQAQVGKAIAAQPDKTRKALNIIKATQKPGSATTIDELLTLVDTITPHL